MKERYAVLKSHHFILKTKTISSSCKKNQWYFCSKMDYWRMTWDQKLKASHYTGFKQVTARTLVSLLPPFLQEKRRPRNTLSFLVCFKSGWLKGRVKIRICFNTFIAFIIIPSCMFRLQVPLSHFLFHPCLYRRTKC